VEALEEKFIENIFRNGLEKGNGYFRCLLLLHPLAIHEAQKSALHHRE
jgi:hypothetical protein